MKSNAFVFIDAHIIKCRLHHHNNNKYSVALKSGKDHQVATQYHSPTDLIINIDTHLALQADKHSFDNFPKLTLIVNAMCDSGEKKTVGTTFANFRKEGPQIFQVSQCSCKDKAFEVEVAFSLKFAEVKGSSSSKGNKIVVGGGDKKLNYFSQQASPRGSREGTDQMISNKKGKSGGLNSADRMKKMHSQKYLLPPKQEGKNKQDEKNVIESLQKQVQQLNSKLQAQQDHLLNINHLSNQLHSQLHQNSLLKELLALQEQKNTEALMHISTLENLIFGMGPRAFQKQSQNLHKFKVIEEKDEIIELNQELQNELQEEREKNNMLELEIDHLRREIQILKKSERQEKIKSLSLSILDHRQPTSGLEPNQILITSICKPNKQNPMIREEEAKLDSLRLDIAILQKKVTELKVQIEILQHHKKELDLIGNGKGKTSQKKPSPSKPGPSKKQDYRKVQKGTNDKISNKPPLKSSKKAPHQQTVTQILSKKSVETNSLNSGQFAVKPTKFCSTQVESKTQRFATDKSFDYLSNEQRSEKEAPNKVEYFTDDLQN